MKIYVQPKRVEALLPTDILFQTTYWSQVKSRLGWKPFAFDFQSSAGNRGDVLVLIRPLGCGLAAAYVFQGPETEPDPEKHGLFLEELSHSMIKYINYNVAFIRYDLPWASPYFSDSPMGDSCQDFPPVRLRELRMNFGTRTWGLRKATTDLTVADTLIIDLARSEDAIFAEMKPKTRYNIRLAQRKGVHVFNASVEMLPLFYQLYLQTAKRNGFPPGTYRHFSALFSALILNPGSSEIIFLLAKKDQDILAGAIIVISRRRAIYLFGASSNERRNLMGPYILHWEGIKQARGKGCYTYDMGSVSPYHNPDHPYFGMYRFKTGFGGKIIHRNGSWDYPLNLQEYEAFRNFELMHSLKFPE